MQLTLEACSLKVIIAVLKAGYPQRVPFHFFQSGLFRFNEIGYLMDGIHNGYCFSFKYGKWKVNSWDGRSTTSGNR
ncbi:hypothetical protein SAMN04487969_104239 [Paenibacillus algorifonticola]|uniref:Uncharacterized protein n=1 Tax=Paenibacillus algorifonticola TaxID=684063 RepID=A0A1I2C4Z3_9BACL|nr:hypothetical protein [Paenibacillus algorifonticola]SFE62690.1 hypothetical protein SAMN04487969_104239 [Paenibacillus algorifonticola]